MDWEAFRAANAEGWWAGGTTKMKVFRAARAAQLESDGGSHARWRMRRTTSTHAAAASAASGDSAAAGEGEGGEAEVGGGAESTGWQRRVTKARCRARHRPLFDSCAPMRAKAAAGWVARGREGACASRRGGRACGREDVEVAKEEGAQ